MSSVYVGVGSNIEKYKHVEAAIHELAGLGQSLRCSKIYECPSLGFEGESFFNLVVELQTSLSLDIFARTLRDIEIRWGRVAETEKFQDRTLDLDLILFDDVVRENPPQLPRPDIYKYPFVIQPLYELCPERIIPGDGRSVRDIWLQADHLDVLTPVNAWLPKSSIFVKSELPHIRQLVISLYIFDIIPTVTMVHKAVLY